MTHSLGLRISLVLALVGIMPLQAAQVIRGPYVQSAAADRMTVCWRTDVATTSELSYGLSTVSLGSPVGEPGTRTDHAVTLTGLQPATQYYYRVQGTPVSGTSVDVGGSGYWFKTAPTPGTVTPVRIWTVGDSGYYASAAINSFNAYMAKTAQQAKTTDVFLMLGDNAYGTGLDHQYQNSVFNLYGSLMKNTPAWSAFGNHDGYAVDPPYTAITPFETSFHFPTTGECGGVASYSERFYSFNRGNIHFVCVDTNTQANYDIPGEGGMVDWLKADLEACTSDWIIAFIHQGPYTKGGHDSDGSTGERELVWSRKYVIPLLETYGVDLVLFAHSHVYERSGLTDGHYGLSSTWDATTMRKSQGNGSDLGGVDPAGNFVTGPAVAGGAYQKPAAIGRAGAVYSVVGASSTVSNWWGGSFALVNPTPHPAHLVSLATIGSMVIEVDGHRLNAQYLGETAIIRDDFTILKGATYTLQGAVPTTQGELSGVAFPVTRTGSTAFAELVPVTVDLISGSGVTPTQAIAQFAAGQISTEVKFFPAGSDPETLFEARLLPTTRSVQPGAAPRAAYRISGGPQTASFGPAEPINASTWYASRFGAPPSSPALWDLDDDGDGLSLLLEYALGGEPGPNDAALLPRGKVEGGSFIYRYTRPPGRTDLSYEALGSADLSSWPLPVLSDVNDGQVTALGEPRRVELPSGSPLKFVRMKISLLP